MYAKCGVECHVVEVISVQLKLSDLINAKFRRGMRFLDFCFGILKWSRR